MRKPKSLLVIFLSLLIFFSCRKHDFEVATTESSISVKRFFNLPASTDPRLKAIAHNTRKQENGHPFLKDLITRAGWPVWDKSKIITKPTQGGKSTTEDNSTLFYIPLVPDTVNTVKAVLAVYTLRFG